jgi:perosamine synthetase
MKRIPLFTSQLTDKDIAEGERVLRRNYQLTKGEEVVEFERALAEYVVRKYCVVVNSGCSALEIALRIIQPDKIVMSPFTYHGVFHVLQRNNISYDFLEIEENTYGFLPCGISSSKRMMTHIAGFPNQNADECLIEDACQGFGARIKNKNVGTFGEIAILSFCQNKVVTTGGEGGALLTDRIGVYLYAKRIREYNYRMSSHAAAIGLSQLSRIDEIIEERRRQAHILNKVYPCALKELPGHYQTYQMYLVKPEVEVPDYVETKMRFDGCELLKEIPLALSQVVAAQSEQK